MRFLLLILLPAYVLAGILPTFSIPGWSDPSPTTLKLSAPATITGIPISKPSGISIVSVSYSGKGCPSGSVSTSLSTDKTVITFGFDKFQAYIGPGTAVADHSKGCNLLLTLKYPPAYSFAVVSSTYHGYAQLDSSVTGKFYSAYFFSSLVSSTFSTSTSVLGGASGLMTNDDATVSTTQQVALKWFTC
ncbi:secreted protein [Diaporthe amygdali]|uniref:uncharacterized protein n=1 Tax=Phomopsis amygdali TaxID=1214568 RepID=UPI0022FEC15F|nr:uncharacterized protein J7T55_001871 [Diaporthe amygdali]KAJ0117672.1 secreted protein [Diaporthe amygdali]